MEYVRRPERLGLGAEPAAMGAKKPKKYIKVRPACRAQTLLLAHRPRRKHGVCVRFYIYVTREGVSAVRLT